MQTSRFVAVILVSMLALFAGNAAVAEAQGTSLQVTGTPPLDAKTIDEIVQGGIAAGEMAGAVVVVAGPEQVHYAKAFGNRQVEPTSQAMTLDTLFDLASLTKPIATATSVMKLVEQGKIELDAPVADYLPEFAAAGKDAITVADLLLHTGGLIPDNALSDYDDGGEKAWQRICRLKPVAARGEKFAYSDVGFIVLGELVHRVSGETLDEFTRRHLFEPLEMNETMFNPSESLRLHAAATEKRNGQWMVGQVHDPRAFRMQGVAGHAGLFSTAADLVRYGQMLLGEGTSGSTTVLAPTTVSTMTTPHPVPRGTRTFGWDHRSPYSRNRGESLSEAAFGHGGFTGTVLWIDPIKEIIFIFLSNRLHPDGKGSVNGLAGQIATAIGRDSAMVE